MVPLAVRGPDGAADLDRGHDRGDADIPWPDISDPVHSGTITLLGPVVIGPGVQRGLLRWEYKGLSEKPPAGR